MPSPNMGLTIPVPSQTGGPQYALDEQSCFQTIDAHNHSPGNGAPIDISGLVVTNNFNMNDLSVTNLKSIQLINQLSSPGVASLYMQNNDLWWTNGTGTYNVQITNNGNVNVTGQIGFVGLPSGTASAVYLPLTGTFRYQSATNVAAKLDVGPIKLRNTSVSSNSVTLNAPSPLASSYDITLPAALPAATKILQMTPTGNIQNSLGVDNSTIEISANNLQLKDGGITNAKLSPTITLPAGSVTPQSRLYAPYFISSTFGGSYSAGNVLISTNTLTTSANAKMIVVGLFMTSTYGYFIASGGVAYVYATIEGGSIGETTIGYLYTSGTDPCIAMWPYFVTSGQATYTIRLRGNGTVGGWGFMSSISGAASVRMWASELG